MTSVSPQFIAHQWPRIRALFSALDLPRSKLQDVGEAWQAGEIGEACAGLVRHFEDRSVDAGLLWAPPMSEEDHRRLADGVLDGVFVLQDLAARVRRRPDGGLDWTDSGPRGDPEWTRFLNRHDFFRSLLRACF